jgi:hypothetical protein
MATNLKGATKKAIYEANVELAGQLGQDSSQFLVNEALSAIESALGDFVVRVQTNINNTEGMVTTGKINDIELKAENNQVNVYANKWLLFQDRGVNGAVVKKYDTPHFYSDKMPPVQVFKTWIKEKNIRLVNEEKYGGKPSPFKELTEDQLINKAAWGMAMKVYKEGFKPRNFYSRELPRLLDDLGELVAKVTIQSINNMIDVKPSAKRQIIK